MRRCDHSQCDGQADHLVEFPNTGDSKAYCQDHYEGVREQLFFDVAEVRRL